MERLTRVSKCGEYLPAKHLNVMVLDTTSEQNLTDILDTLGKYEDTELAPEEILNGLELANIWAALEKLKEYQKAKLKELEGENNGK